MELDFEDQPQAPCLQCGDELEPWGIYGRVVPTFFCKACCSGAKYSAGGHLHQTMTKAQALHYYCCTDEDLKRLNHGLSIGDRRNRRTLYLVAEVEYLADQRTLTKKHDLEITLGVKLEEMDPLIRTYLLGDYLHKHQPRGKFSMQDVVQRFGVIDRVMAIVIGCEKADPGAAFDFCLTYPDGGPAEFQELKHKCNKAFHLEGYRILKRLSSADVLRLMQTHLKDIAQRFLNEKFVSDNQAAHGVHL